MASGAYLLVFRAMVHQRHDIFATVEHFVGPLGVLMARLISPTSYHDMGLFLHRFSDILTFLFMR